MNAPAIEENSVTPDTSVYLRSAVLTPQFSHHIQQSEVRKGRPVGFHHAPSGVFPGNVTIVGSNFKNHDSVYTINFTDSNDQKASPTVKTSSMFPNRMTHQDVLGAVRHALDHATSWDGVRNKFRGPSGQGFMIEGYVRDGQVHTAYPIDDGS